MKIKTKLLLLTSLIVLILIIMVSTMYVKSSSILREVATIEGLTQISNETYATNIYFSGLRNIVENSAHGIEMLFDENSKVSYDALNMLLMRLHDLNKTNGAYDCYVGLENEPHFSSGIGWNPDSDYDYKTRPWYTEAVAAKKTIITTPYIDAQTNELVITIAAPIHNESHATSIHNDSPKLLGVIAVDFFLSRLSARVAEMNVMGVGYGILVAPDGLILEHPNKNLAMQENITKTSSNISTELAAIGEKMLLPGTNGWADYPAATGEMRRIFYASSESGYTVALIASHKEIDGIVGKITILLIVIGVTAVIIMGLFMLFLIPSIIKPLRIVENSLKRMSDLDLSADEQMKKFVSGVNTETEVGAMTVSLSHLHHAFNNVLGRVNGEVERVADASCILDTLSDKANTEIAKSQVAMANIGGQAEEALKAVEATADATEDVSKATTMTADAAVQAAEASLNTSKLSGDVSAAVNSFVKELQNMGHTMQENSEGMFRVGEAVTSISGFVTTIGNIASQTNLLALNAAIEAARAGEAGRGFAVVAEEVRKLAEESNAASLQVNELIEKLKGETSSAITSTQKSTEAISKIVVEAESARNNLDDTLTEIRKVNDAVQSIAAAAQEQAATSNEISHSTNQVRENVSELRNNIGTVNNTAEETARVIESVAVESKNLSNIAARLSNVMSDFTIEETAANLAGVYQIDRKK